MPSINFLVESEKSVILQKVKDRKKKSLKDIHFAANILDPSFNGKSLTDDEQIAGTEFIHKCASNMYNEEDTVLVLKQLAEFRLSEGYFAKPYVVQTSKELDALLFWKGICINLKLSAVAIKILEMPATSAATERSFSTYGNIHNAKRNCLTTERAGQLAYVSHNLKLLNVDGFGHTTNCEDEDNSSIEIVSLSDIETSDSETESNHSGSIASGSD